MTEYFNPPVLGDFSASGVSSGTSMGGLLFTNGLALDPATGRRRADAVTIADETRICLENIAIVLAEAGLGLQDVIKMTCYLRAEEFRGEFIAAYKAVFDPGPYPYRGSFVIGIAADCRVQIEAIAVHPAAA